MFSFVNKSVKAASIENIPVKRITYEAHVIWEASSGTVGVPTNPGVEIVPLESAETVGVPTNPGVEIVPL